MDAILADSRMSVIAFMVLSTALFIALAELVRSYFVTKRAELRMADEALNRHFAALSKVLNDEAVSSAVKHSLLQISTAFCQKGVARRVAQGIKTGKKPVLSAESQQALEAVIGEVKTLAERREDLAEAIMEAVNFGFASMVLRWPETEIMMARTVMLDAEVDGGHSGFTKKTACVLAQIERSPSESGTQPVLQGA